LSISYTSSFNMSSRLAVPVSRSPFTVIPHPRFSALQACPIPLPSWVLCNHETKKYRNETVMHMVNVLCYISRARWTPFVTQTIHCVLCWLQRIDQILILYFMLMTYQKLQMKTLKLFYMQMTLAQLLLAPTLYILKINLLNSFKMLIDGLVVIYCH
jgi:hypothetical protein